MLFRSANGCAGNYSSGRDSIQHLCSLVCTRCAAGPTGLNADRSIKNYHFTVQGFAMTRARHSTWLACVWLMHMLAAAAGSQALQLGRPFPVLTNDTQQDNALSRPLSQRKDKSLGDDDSQYFAMCVAAKDQHADIDEWVIHHEKMGAGKIYVYDDNSEPPMRDQLLSHIQSGLVEYHFLGRDNHTAMERPQLWVYNECINQYRALHQFVAFIDVDEFLILRDPSTVTLPALLHDYEEYGGLAVNWVLFGSSGHIHRPQGGTLANYWKCVPPSHPENLHVKTIANMKYVAHVSGTPHFFHYNEGKTAVNEKFDVVEGARTRKNEIERVVIYHFVTKSKEEFKHKAARGSGMKNHKSEGFFDAVDRLAVEDCRDGMQSAAGRQHSRSTHV